MKNIHILPTSLPSRLGYLTKKGKEVFKDLRLFDVFMPTILDGENQNIYITNDEEIKDGDWFLEDIIENLIFQRRNSKLYSLPDTAKKIILTTDQELINNGAQKIDDDFLEWFVNNSSCEFVDVEKTMYMPFDGKVAFELSLDESLNTRPYYKIIIPEKEPKQEVQGYICPQTKKQCDDECCVSAEDCHIEQSIGVISDCEPEQETLEAAENYSKITLNKGGLMSNKQINGFIAGAKWQADRMYTEDDFKLFARQYYRDIKLNKSNLLWDDLADKCLEEFKKK
jgi:hypothetical protein